MLYSSLPLKLIQWRHVCDITIICTTSQSTTPTTQQPQSSATTRLGGYYSSSLANIYAVEARLRTGKRKTQLLIGAILAARQ